jgi:hypothetical protein
MQSNESRPVANVEHECFAAPRSRFWQAPTVTYAVSGLGEREQSDG